MHAFDVLGDPVRRRILELLGDGELTSGALCGVIQREFGISQPAVSQHLKVLRDNGFATVRPDGARRLYAVAHEPLRGIDAWLDQFRRSWTPHLDALATELARGKHERRKKTMIDVTEEISAVRREVGGRVLEAGQVRVVTVSRSYPAELADVWDACTNPERIPRWFLPVSGDLKEGGRYQLEGNADGTVTRCDPPHGFDATWEMGGDMSWIELRLADEGNGRTLFRLDHIAHVDDERWAQFGPGAVGVGWDSGLIGLYLHLTTGQAVDPAKVAGWSASEEGHRFLAASSDAWYEASVAFGTDPAEARAAADRTTAFYTGTPEPSALPAIDPAVRYR